MRNIILGVVVLSQIAVLSWFLFPASQDIVLGAVKALQTAQGGTGTTTIPALGEVLVGQANGTYAPVATSTLGLSGGTGTSLLTNSGSNTYLNTGTNLQAPTFEGTSTATSAFAGPLSITGHVTTDGLKARTSSGIDLQASNGTPVCNLGAGGGANVTCYNGFTNYGVHTAYGVITGPYFTSTSTTASQLPYASSTAATVSERLYIGDGNSTVPGIAFTNDQDTGIYRAASNALSFLAAGNVAIWNGDALYPLTNNARDLGRSGNKWANLYATRGTTDYASSTVTSGDSLCIGTDCRTTWPVSGVSSFHATTSANTFVYPLAGLYHSAPYYVATSTTGTSTFAGAFGIGTTSPQSVVQVITGSGNGSSVFSTRIGRSATQYVQISGDVTADYIQTAGSGKPLYIGANGTAIAIHGSGNVGIGTTSPYSKLSVEGQVVAQNYVATSTTLASTFAGLLGIATSSPWKALSVAGEGIFTDVLNLASSTLMSAVEPPSASPASKLYVFARSILGKMFLSIKGPSGLDYELQPALFDQAIAWVLPGSGTTLTSGGMVATAVGTVSHPGVTTTNRASSTKRFRLTSAATANSASEIRNASTMVIGSNGYFFRTTFTCASGATSRGFLGLTSGTGAISTSQDPNALTQMVGFGWSSSSASTTLHFMVNDGSGNASWVNLGANFPTASTSMVFELTLFTVDGTSISYQAKDVRTGNSTSGTVSSDLPTSTTALTPHLYMNNGGAAVAVILDIANLYIQTDY